MRIKGALKPFINCIGCHGARSGGQKLFTCPCATTVLCLACRSGGVIDKCRSCDTEYLITAFAAAAVKDFIATVDGVMDSLFES